MAGGGEVLVLAVVGGFGGVARLEELEAERNRYKWLFEHAVHGIFQASLGQGLRAANPALAQMLGYDDPQQVLWSLEDMAGQLFVGGEA
ncbi:PAS domain-containing protein, partial [Pseudomonas aeruginosa]